LQNANKNCWTLDLVEFIHRTEDHVILYYINESAEVITYKSQSSIERGASSTKEDLVKGGRVVGFERKKPKIQVIKTMDDFFAYSKKSLEYTDINIKWLSLLQF